MAVREVTISRISPLSAFRTGLALSLAGLAIWVLMVLFISFGLSHYGIFDKINDVVGVVGGEGKFTVTFTDVLTVASLVGAIIAICTTIAAPLLAIIYNGMVELFGGLTVTTRETRR